MHAWRSVALVLCGLCGGPGAPVALRGGPGGLWRSVAALAGPGPRGGPGALCGAPWRSWRSLTLRGAPWRPWRSLAFCGNCLASAFAAPRRNCVDHRALCRPPCLVPVLLPLLAATGPCSPQLCRPSRPATMSTTALWFAAPRRNCVDGRALCRPPCPVPTAAPCSPQLCRSSRPVPTFSAQLWRGSCCGQRKLQVEQKVLEPKRLRVDLMGDKVWKRFNEELAYTIFNLE